MTRYHRIARSIEEKYDVICTYFPATRTYLVNEHKTNNATSARRLAKKIHNTKHPKKEI